MAKTTPWLILDGHVPNTWRITLHVELSLRSTQISTSLTSFYVSEPLMVHAFDGEITPPSIMLHLLGNVKVQALLRYKEGFHVESLLSCKRGDWLNIVVHQYYTP